MRIKDIAGKLNISARAIRFYEQKGLISPRKQEENRYRLFTEEDAWRLQTIIALREVGMSVKEIKKILDEMNEGERKNISYYLELQRAAIFAKWVELKQMITTIDQMIAICKEKSAPDIEEMYRLSEGSKRLRECRESWYDRWNFDRCAMSYDSELHHHHAGFDVRNHYKQVLDLTVKWVNPRIGEKGLDIGTGTGNLAGRFSDKGISIAGVDQSREMLAQCRSKYPKMETKLGNFLALPYVDSQFDFVVTSLAFHHITNEQQPLALEEMKRVLKPSGRICITDLMYESIEDRERYIKRLKQQGQEEAIHLMENKHYAFLPDVLYWFEENDYITKHKRIDNLLYIVYAVPIR
ncbi:methyltransferase domain-containing protein [Aneurinibacillus aneurinilyticus]|uniref:Methyltransferase domain-containing protein n=2 Tax=Aneurinibacillus aneurinilyticus TaxID=1391 RepID=A0A848CSQ8_ANEAE|nr:MerR family transcriptional regulator [Aneurinibacillus aneurinilyticus]NME98031.1 methyltransferase domain-containing protein [Aneurinibacillus aneurinilyticus]